MVRMDLSSCWVGGTTSAGTAALAPGLTQNGDLVTPVGAARHQRLIQVKRAGAGADGLPQRFISP